MSTSGHFLTPQPPPFFPHQHIFPSSKRQILTLKSISGSIDFIWGYSKAYFHQCYIASNTAGYITAQNRPSASWAGGYIFDACYVTYTSTYGSSTGTTYLGRPWSQYAIVVYMNSYLDKHISPEGWHIWSTSSPQTSVSTLQRERTKYDRRTA